VQLLFLLLFYYYAPPKQAHLSPRFSSNNDICPKGFSVPTRKELAAETTLAEKNPINNKTIKDGNGTALAFSVGSGGGVESLIQRTLRLRSSISASALEKPALLGPINKKPLSAVHKKTSLA
jgi:hypothetical protein